MQQGTPTGPKSFGAGSPRIHSVAAHDQVQALGSVNLSPLMAAIPELRERLRAMAHATDFIQFARHSYDGLSVAESGRIDVPPPSPVFMALWGVFIERVKALVLRWLEDSLEPDVFERHDVSLLMRRVAATEALLNSELLRWCEDDLAWASFAALATFAGAPFRFEPMVMHPGLQLGFTITRQGCILSILDASGPDSARLEQRPVLQLGSACFVAAFPLRLTSGFELGLRCGSRMAADKNLLSALFVDLMPGKSSRNAGRAAHADPAAWNRAPSSSTDLALAQIRVATREVCALVEEWEFSNAALAVRYMRAREGMDQPDHRRHETRPSASSPAALVAIAEERDQLALWCLASLVDLQAATEGMLCQGADADVVDEARAFDAIALAAVQKLCLPASVSRHDYHPAVCLQMREWFDERRKRSGSSPRRDLAHDLVSVALESALGAPADWVSQACFEILRFIGEGPTHRWVMSFDPSVVMKAFSWLQRPGNHLVLTLTFAALLRRKSMLLVRAGSEGQLDSGSSALALSTLQMPRSFGPVRHGTFDGRDTGDAAFEQSSEWLLLAQQSSSWMSCDTVDHYSEGAMSWQSAWTSTLKSFGTESSALGNNAAASQTCSTSEGSHP